MSERAGRTARRFNEASQPEKILANLTHAGCIESAGAEPFFLISIRRLFSLHLCGGSLINATEAVKPCYYHGISPVQHPLTLRLQHRLPMPFISAADHASVTFGDGVYNNVQGNLNHTVTTHYHNHFYGKPDSVPGQDQEDEDEIEVIQKKHISLLCEIGDRLNPQYRLHAGRARGRASIIKVFTSGPTARKCLESTVALSRNLMHPNVLGIEAISSSKSTIHFIAYENVHWKDATAPLAMALSDELSRSVTLGFKLIAGLASGMHYLSLQGISFASLSVQNFDIFCDVDERFLVSINPKLPSGNDTDVESKPYGLFVDLIRKTFRSISHTLYDDEVEPDNEVLNWSTSPNSSITELPRGLPRVHELRSSASDKIREQPRSAPPRREYVWRGTQQRYQSLSSIARQIELQLEMNRLNLNRVIWRDDPRQLELGCAPSMWEEIILGPTTADSAVVLLHPPIRFRCWDRRCGDLVVPANDGFDCMCCEFDPTSKPTVQCHRCRYWMHRECDDLPKTGAILCKGCIQGPSKDTVRAGTKVFFWDGNGRIVYGVVRCIRCLRDGSVVVDIRTMSRATITLPISSVQKVS
ncbi:hypothetical protein C8R46DRAFT_37867 [Mycena filopes]|nr:hypothetical protein C8R46DRAFT_37867 [Mycena filopes]